MITKLPEKASSRAKSWITLTQISLEYPEFIDKIADILYYPEYNERSKDFARSLLIYIQLWGWVSWKQFDSIFKICRTYQEYKDSLANGISILRYKGVISVHKGPLHFTVRTGATTLDSHLSGNMTDRELDRWHRLIFNCDCPFEEEIEEGMTRMYRKDGSRYFALTEPNILDFVPNVMQNLFEFEH